MSYQQQPETRDHERHYVPALKLTEAGGYIGGWVDQDGNEIIPTREEGFKLKVEGKE